MKSSAYRPETPPVLAVLKRALKKKKITYSVLAEHLGLSEIAIKKMFQAEDMGLDRLLKICKFIGVKPEALFAASSNRPLEVARLSEKQAEYLMANPHVFSFYLKLVYERTSVAAIREEFGLTEAGAWKYLKKLDDLGMIRLKAGEEFDLATQPPMAVDTQGRPGFEKYRRSTAAEFFARVCKESSDSKQIKMSSFKLSEEKARNLNADLEKIIFRYKRISEIEQVTDSGGLGLWTMLAALAPFSFISGIREIR